MDEQFHEDNILAGTSPRIKRSQDFNVDEPDTPLNDDLSRLVSSAGMITCDACQRQFKGARGLKIHRSKTQCGESQNRLLPDDSNSELFDSLDKSHNTNQKLFEVRDRKILYKLERRSCINWPKMSNLPAWTNFDEDVTRIVKSFLFGTIEDKLEKFEKYVHAVAVEHFGVKPLTPFRQANRPSRRKRRVEELRRQQRDLRKRFKKSTDFEKEGINELMKQVHEEILALRRRERACKRRRERKRTRNEFMRNPYRTAKKILEPVCKSQLNCTKEDLDNHIRQTYSSNSEESFHAWPGSVAPDPPIFPFNDSPPSFQELKRILDKTRNASSPGRNALPYKMYKKCPRLLRVLWNLMKVVWQTKNIPVLWRVAEGVYIPKSASPDEKSISDFRPISLLSVEAKLFFAIYAKRIEKFMRSNQYLDTSVQKGGVEGHPGVWEHISSLWEVIKDAKKSQKNMAAIWLDLANAYGSVPHGAIMFALKWYHFPPSLTNLIDKYYSGLYARFSVRDWNSEWQKFSIGIFMGCTLSPILFVTTFNLLNEFLKSTKVNQYHMKEKDFNIPVLKEYMDDIAIVTASISSANIVLNRVNEFMRWSRMRIKPVKSRSLVLLRGKVVDVEPFVVENQTIPGVQTKPVKFLGRCIDGQLDDKAAREEMMITLKALLGTVDKCYLTGLMKCWIYQHIIVPRMQWKLMIYDVPISQVERMEVCVAVKMRKWLGVSRIMSDVALFCHQAKLRLPLEGLVSTMKKTAVNAVLQLRYSTDEAVTRIQPTKRSGRKWDANRAIVSAESTLHMEDMVRGQFGRQGLGCGNIRKPAKKLSPRERRAEIVSLSVREHDESQYVRAIQMPVQGAWTAWENVRQRKLSWRNLFDTSPRLLQFILGATYDTIPSPVNLKRWGIQEEDTCHLCKGRATTTHVLAGCPKSLTQGRYTWRHNRVLRVISDACGNHIARHNQKPAKRTIDYIKFVKGGEKLKGASPKTPFSCLNVTNDWKIKVDLNEKLVFPQEIFSTTLRPDIVIWSNDKKRVHLIELTVPDESGMESAHQRKCNKYEDLVVEIQRRGWAAELWTVEIGCRGFSNGSLSFVLRRLGVSSKLARQIEGEACRCAEKASFHLWIMRNVAEWSAPTMS